MVPVQLHAVRLFREVFAAHVHRYLMIDPLIERGVVTRSPGRNLQREVERGPARTAAHDETADIAPLRIGFVELARGDGAAPRAPPAIDRLLELPDGEALYMHHQVLADE